MARVFVKVDDGNTRGLHRENVYVNGRLSEFRTEAEVRYREPRPPESPHWFGGQDVNASSERFRTGAGYDVENELFYTHRERETELMIREVWCAWVTINNASLKER